MCQSQIMTLLEILTCMHISSNNSKWHLPMCLDWHWIIFGSTRLEQSFQVKHISNIKIFSLRVKFCTVHLIVNAYLFMNHVNGIYMCVLYTQYNLGIIQWLYHVYADLWMGLDGVLEEKGLIVQDIEYRTFQPGFKPSIHGLQVELSTTHLFDLLMSGHKINTNVSHVIGCSS